MLQVEEKDGSLSIPPFGSTLKLVYTNKHTEEEQVARITPGPTKNHYFAYFEQDDVDFEMEMDNSSCKDRAVCFGMEVLKERHGFVVGPKEAWKIETLESNGKKLHFIRQSGEKGKSLVSSTASAHEISRQDASSILSQIKFQVQYEVKNFVIMVKDEQYKNTSLEVTSQTTIDEMKNKIAREIRHPGENFSLTFNGKECDDYDSETTLDELKINEECKLICKKIEFPVQVKMEGKKRCTILKVSSWDLVQDLKKKIEEKEGVSIAQQKLFFNEKELYFNKSALGWAGITRNSMFELEIIENFPLKIKIVPSPNKIITVPICSRNTIRDIMNKIKEQEGISTEEQDLYFNGSLISNNTKKLLQDVQGLNESVTLFLGVTDKNNAKKALKNNNNEEEEDNGQKSAKIQKKTPHECETRACFPITVLNRVDNSTINLNVCSSELVGDVKEKIREKIGIPVENQKIVRILHRHPNEKPVSQSELHFEDCPCRFKQELYDSFPLELYEIQENSTLVLIFRRVGDFGLINVKCLTGKTFTLPFFPTETVFDLKCRIEEETGIPPDQPRLIFDNRQMENEQTLSHYKIQTEDLIYLVLRLRGGGGHPLCQNPSCSSCAADFTTDFSEPGAITFGGKSSQTFSSCSFDADESIDIEPFIIELRLAGVPLIP